jgi:periplasmic protein CpxP/Spy
MRRIPMIVLACLLAAGPALAADEHDHAKEEAKPPSAGMPMREHMKLMREQMAQMRAATDPKEKERLMSEHLKTMEQSMAKMQGMMGQGMMGCEKM